MPEYDDDTLRKLADSVAESMPSPNASGKDQSDYRQAQEAIVTARRNAESHASLRRGH